MAKIPESIDKYKIESLVASGGMGAVFKGIHPTLKRAVILKKLTIRGSASIAERFRREARILMDFKNDNIVDVHDHFKSGSTHYIVMEFVDGVSLQGMIGTHRYLDNASAAFILLETAKALSYAHDRKVVHRDIKPANILISKTGQVKLADFGIASSRGDNDENETLTKEGMTLGTPSYMAPEQFDSTRSVDNRADIYSLGVMLYEMVTGKKPFPGGFSHELVMAIKKGKYKSPKKLNPHLSGFLQGMLKKLMKANMNGRVKDLKDIIPSLERYVDSFDPELLQQRIISLVKGKKSDPVQPRKQPWLIRTLSIAVPGALVLGFVVLYGMISGFPLRFFGARDYGEVQFTLDLKDYYKETGETSIQTSLFIDDNANIPDYEYDPIFFPDMFSEEQKLVSIPFHLPSGHYRAKTVVDDYNFWQSFYVASWEANGEPNKVLQIIKPEPRYQVETRYNISNALTGAVINAAEVKVFMGGRYQNVSDVENLLSNAQYSFRVEAPGFVSQDFVLWIAAHQRNLTLNAQLVPSPGLLKITRSNPDIRLRINEKNSIQAMGGRFLVNTPIVNEEETTLWLPPGQYALDFRYGGSELTRTVTVSDGAPVTIIVTEDDGQLSLR